MSVIPIQPNGTRRPLFCVHAASGLADIYVPLSRHLDQDQPVYGFQSYKFDEGLSPDATIEDLATQYIADLREILPSGPYQIGGYSSGGIVAYEMAQQLCEAGEEISLLLMFDTEPRSQHVEDKPLTEEDLEARVRQYLSNRLEYFNELGSLTIDEVGAMPFDELLSFSLSCDKAGNRVPQELTEMQYLQLQRTRILNPYAARRYRPKPYPGRITLYRCNGQDDQGHDYGWGDLALGGVDVDCFDSTHPQFIFDPNASALAAKLSILLDGKDQEIEPACLQPGAHELRGAETDSAPNY